VAEEEKGDVHGRIDHAELGRAMHQVGYCLSSMGRYEEARPWLERAVAEAEKGDVHGRIDHGSLGSSLHQVGYCLLRTGRYAEAQQWFERAVAEKEKGGLFGRIDHASLGISLHGVGDCLLSTGRLRKRNRGLSAPWRKRKKVTCMAAWITRAWQRRFGRSRNAHGTSASTMPPEPGNSVTPRLPNNNKRHRNHPN
jgi:tetratricopeptide (TPR) repeat protein